MSPSLITHRKWAPVQHKRKRAKQALDVSWAFEMEVMEMRIVCALVGFSFSGFVLQFKKQSFLAKNLMSSTDYQQVVT